MLAADIYLDIETLRTFNWHVVINTLITIDSNSHLQSELVASRKQLVVYDHHAHHDEIDKEHLIDGRAF